ncbi:MAG: hypothetical protein H2035_07990 [Acidimicrobiales bacterium]|nr:hypothetical protein [Acidimicrobiales bacterium]RPH17743.1 MAG: hypothetical protein CBE30_004135 [Actinobacteria bacterium TMED270]HBQ04333.1 hypothetical protein [Acidimicrobiaceae bacterium]HCJ85777.1 hypothetical protein [Acidimicrobiaceae bacterium]
MTTKLSPDALQLLPSQDETPKCSSHSQLITADPCGTALSVEALILIEIPLPWPKPVFDHPLLHGLSSTMKTSLGQTRVLAVVPRDEEPGFGVLVYQRAEVGVNSWAFRPPNPLALAQFKSEIIKLAPSELTTTPRHSDPSDLAVLICTQGSHDICCGSEGTKLANELEQRAPGLNILRVSHTGGHRFAPTAMTLPDGRMWAYLDVDTTLSILELTGEPETLSSQCRGWWGAPSGPGQVAERAVFSEIGWDLDTLPRNITVTPSEFGWTVNLLVALQEWSVDVSQGREIPAIACRAQGGLPAKASYEYTARKVTAPR